MTPFKYGGFWDVPRTIVIHCRGRYLLMQSAFDEELDDYSATYSAYLLPHSIGDSIQAGSWDCLYRTPQREIGQIPVNSVSFDDRKRNEVDGTCLDRLIDR